MKPVEELRSVVRVVLDDVFPSHSPSKGALYHVVLLEKTGLYYQKLQTSQSRPESEVDHFVQEERYNGYECLSGKDIVGCQCMRDPTYDTPEASTPPSRTAYFCIYAYPIRKQSFVNGLRRQRFSITFTVNKHGTFAENLSVAEAWCDAIRCMLHGGPPSDSDPGQLLPMTIELTVDSHSVDRRMSCRDCQQRRKLLVLVNPNSGPGKASKIFNERVVPVLAEAGVSYDLVTTARPKEAQDIVKDANLSEWHGIVIVSGDGLVFEVINGLMARSDWSSAIRIPLGIIPGGSGNGLAQAISHASREPIKTNQKLFAAFNVAKGRTAPMDVIRVMTANETLYSFLAIGWGIIADIDIESERLRSIGAPRFTIWALARILDLRVYRGKVSYLPALDATKSPQTSKSSSISGDVGDGSSNVIRPNGDRVLQRAQSTDATEEVKPNRGHVATSTSCLVNMSREEDAADTVPDTEDCRDSLEPVDDVEIGTSLEPEEETSSSRSSSSSPSAVGATSLLPPLGEPLPDTWIRHDEEDFVLVYVSFQSHISTSVLMAPNAMLDDGLMWMTIVRRGVTRSQLVSFLLAIETGAHVDLPFVEMTPVRAFRLEPMSPNGYLTVDGELVDYGPIQAEVMPGVARVMVL